MPTRPTNLFTAAAAIACALTTAAQAAVTISNDATKNMTCTAGVCTPTGGNANLNVGELQSMLASSDVTVKSSATVPTLGVLDAVTWDNSHRLTLDAYQSVHIRASIGVQGTNSGLTLITNDGGTGGDYIFEDGGYAKISDFNSTLTINGTAYTLVGDIQSLVSDIAANPSGNYALMQSILGNTYNEPPISTAFLGTFEGLGNTIDKLSIQIVKNAPGHVTGLFESIGTAQQAAGEVHNLLIQDEQIRAPNQTSVGGLAGLNFGVVSNVRVSGAMKAGQCMGGLVGENHGTIANSGSGVTVSRGNYGGGLACLNYGTIFQSFATRRVSAGGAGGLVAENYGVISQSFASGDVSGTVAGGLVSLSSSQGAVFYSYALGSVGQSFTQQAGGLIGVAEAPSSVAFVYATGAVDSGSVKGGVFGTDNSGHNTSAFWNRDTSGIASPHQGAGSPLDDPGVRGRTDAQLKSQLPHGFDRQIWGQDPNINSGWPYLLANPPQ